MENYRKHLIRNLGISDLGLLKPDEMRLMQTCLWRAYGVRECFGAFTYQNDMNTWLGHMYCQENWRGKIAIEIFKEACWRMFQDVGCHKILGLTPKERRDAIIAARYVGFKRIGEAGGYVFSLLEKGDI